MPELSVLAKARQPVGEGTQGEEVAPVAAVECQELRPFGQ